MSYLIPNVLEKTSDGERVFDLYSRLLRDRLIFCNGEVEENMANILIAQMLYLDSVDSSKPINLYINSPGGSITAGSAIMDTMDYIQSPVRTIAIGLAASMGSEILANGTKGMRCSLPRARILLHMASGGSKGQILDVHTQVKELDILNDSMLEAMSKNTGKPIKQLKADMDRDFWMSSYEAVEYGVIDKVIEKV
jgi:ATP-dependent Clp protease protease subunit